MDSFDDTMAEEDISAELAEPTVPSFTAEVLDFVTANGWFLLLGLVATYIAWAKFLEPRYKQWCEDSEKTHLLNNPDLVAARLAAVEASRQKMQERYAADTEKHKEKMKKKEEQRRQEILGHATDGPNAGHLLNERASQSCVTNRTKSKPPLKDSGYDPLAGGSSSSGYRPSRPSCPSGGCGR